MISMCILKGSLWLLIRECALEARMKARKENGEKEGRGCGEQ